MSFLYHLLQAGLLTQTFRSRCSTVLMASWIGYQLAGQPWASYLPFRFSFPPSLKWHDKPCFRGLLRGLNDLMDVHAWNCAQHKKSTAVLFGIISSL